MNEWSVLQIPVVQRRHLAAGDVVQPDEKVHVFRL